jgi:FMN-dependent NADH-azoreductase
LRSIHKGKPESENVASPSSFHPLVTTKNIMPTLLHLDASPRGHLSISRQLSAAAVAAWKDKHPGGKVIERDLTTKFPIFGTSWVSSASPM